MNDFLKDVIKETGNEYAAVVSEGVEAGDVDNCSRWRKCDRKNFLSYGNG